MTRQRFLTTGLVYIAVVFFVGASAAHGERRIRDLCRVKGQEENTLLGHGLVVGLNGTGDTNFLAKSRALARMLHNMGHPVLQDTKGQDLLDELKASKNVAVVMVTATVPAAGAKQGDKLNCVIKAYGNAKSLEGGYLMTTLLTGIEPTADPGQRRVYATAQGQIRLDNPALAVSGNIYNGCRLEHTFKNEFTDNGMVTLVLERNHATFRLAQDIAHVINEDWRSQNDTLAVPTGRIAKAIDQVHVQVKLPEEYVDFPVEFISDLLDIPIVEVNNDARVVVNEATGTIIIGAKVEIATVAVSHQGFSIEAGGPFFALDSSIQGQVSGDYQTVKLKSLVDSLNALKASSKDIIDIIKALKRSGDLYGNLIIEE